MVPIIRFCTVAGIPITQFLSRDKLDAIVKRTQLAGGEVVNLLKTSAWVSPATAAMEMAEAYLKDKKRVLPCAAYLEGEYGVKNVYVGVPARLGAKGVEKIYEFELDASELDRRVEAALGGIDSASLSARLSAAIAANASADVAREADQRLRAALSQLEGN